jgi:hypothetical protein
LSAPTYSVRATRAQRSTAFLDRLG